MSLESLGCVKKNSVETTVSDKVYVMRWLFQRELQFRNLEDVVAWGCHRFGMERTTFVITSPGCAVALLFDTRWEASLWH